MTSYEPCVQADKRKYFEFELRSWSHGRLAEPSCQIFCPFELFEPSLHTKEKARAPFRGIRIGFDSILNIQVRSHLKCRPSLLMFFAFTTAWLHQTPSLSLIVSSAGHTATLDDFILSACRPCRLSVVSMGVPAAYHRGAKRIPGGRGA